MYKDQKNEAVTKEVLYSIPDEKGRIIAELDKEGYLTEYRYQVSDEVRLTIIYANRIPIPATCPSTFDGLRPKSSPKDQVISNTYDENGKLFESAEGDKVYMHYYDSAGRELSISKAWSLGLLGNTSSLVATDSTTTITEKNVTEEHVRFVPKF